MLYHKHPECGELAWIYSQGMKHTNDLVILKCSHELVIEVVLICCRLQLHIGWVLLKKVIFVGKEKKTEEKMEDLKFVLCCHLLSDLVLQHPHPKMLCKCYRQCHYRKCRCKCKCNLLHWFKLQANPIRQYWISQSAFSLWYSDSMSIWMGWLFCFRCLYQWSLSQRRNMHWAEWASSLSLFANIRRGLLPDRWAF